ncbi:speckle-type POZ protein-like [Microplitis mediator]|uniref:speckle-type POZ protein-like n=1 Tax=Microplitis mediator TaxID=375433 RepID=UPI002553B947|nr:speckle-type POZ protein-like [Microplitis mediator]XP_057317988.1 speckle-type POZ protein-like [Microplitis mediator]
MEDFKMIKSYSIPKEEKVIFEWKIDQFLSIMKFTMDNKNAKTIRSPTFKTVETSYGWYLEINFNYENESVDKDWISIKIRNFSDDQITAKYSLFIFDNKKKKKFENKLYKIFKSNESWCISKFLNVNQLLEKKDKLLPDNALTICIKLTEFIDCSYSYSPTIKIPLKTSNHNIVHDSKELFDSKAGSDVVLVVGDKKIPAHKTFLMFRSPVFFAMFTHQLKENRENEVDIPDMDPDVCEKLLEFIYTDNVTNLGEVSDRLHEVADKYQLPALKELCEESCCKNVNVENAVKYLVLLDRHNAGEEFFKYILDFIAINSKNIIETPEFKALEKTNPELSLTIVTKICSIK